jgi:hypothetical protein
MIKNILLTLLLVCPGSFSGATYSIGKYKSGTPYIRLKIPESTSQFTCFNEEAYERFIGLSLEQPAKDSLLDVTYSQLKLCQENKLDLDSALSITKVQADTIFTRYESLNKELEVEKWKKWYWGGIGTVFGSLLGGLLTAIFIAR